MRKLSTTTALVTSIGFTVMTAASAQADTHDADVKAEAEVEVSAANTSSTIEQIESADTATHSYDELSTAEAAAEAVAELDITDEDEAGLSAEALAEIDAMNGIISILIDAEAIYKQAADMPDDNEAVRIILRDLASERETQTVALQQRVVALGGEADQFGEATGTAHRVFAQLRTLTDNDTEVAIEEVLRGERYIVNEIGKVLEGDISPDGEMILEALRDDVYADIKRLEDVDDIA